MAHPLFDLARALEKRRTRVALDDVLSDADRARDIGLSHRPAPRKLPVTW